LVLSTGLMIGSSGPLMQVVAFMNITGSAGMGIFASRAWAR
jgi:hypothetical protein